jgi:hypothetical protein
MARKPRAPKAEQPASPEPAKIGRPSVFTQEIADTICKRMMQGETLRQIVRDDAMPCRSSVHNWLATNKAFMDQYAQAREFQADTIFDEMFDIADDGSNDWMLRKQGDDDIEVVNHEHIQRSKLRIDTRKWALARMAPKKYGEKVETTLRGDADAPLEVEDRSVARQIAYLLAGAVRANDPR